MQSINWRQSRPVQHLQAGVETTFLEHICTMRERSTLSAAAASENGSKARRYHTEHASKRASGAALLPVGTGETVGLLMAKTRQRESFWRSKACLQNALELRESGGRHQRESTAPRRNKRSTGHERSSVAGH